jgi:hypothetical protein
MTQEDLIKAIDQAKSAFKTMMDNDQKLKELKGYFVLSSPHGQFQLTDDPLKISQILKDFPTMISESEFKEDTFIEIRFEKPILDLIFKMQKDPLVSQVHTPQTRASIRIVLGTLRELAQRAENVGANKDEQKQL